MNAQLALSTGHKLTLTESLSRKSWKRMILGLLTLAIAITGVGFSRSIDPVNLVDLHVIGQASDFPVESMVTNSFEWLKRDFGSGDRGFGGILKSFSDVCARSGSEFLVVVSGCLGEISDCVVDLFGIELKSELSPGYGPGSLQPIDFRNHIVNDLLGRPIRMVLEAGISLSRAILGYGESTIRLWNDEAMDW